MSFSAAVQNVVLGQLRREDVHISTQDDCESYWGAIIRSEL